VAGASDEHTTLHESQELYAAAANPKGLWKDHHDMLAVEYGPDVYLVKDSDSAPDFFFEQRASWPFKYFVDHP
jgi:hypothetical protein